MLAASAQTVIVIFFSVTLVIVAFKLLIGQIIVRGLLTGKEDGKFSPGRLQLLMATLGGAIFYFVKIAGATDMDALPPVPTELLLLVGGSNVGYLGGKIYSKFFNNNEHA